MEDWPILACDPCPTELERRTLAAADTATLSQHADLQQALHGKREREIDIGIYIYMCVLVFCVFVVALYIFFLCVFLCVLCVCFLFFVLLFVLCAFCVKSIYI